MIIQLTLFIFMLFGIAALTIDMGLVRLTQMQMQNAADTAALEGLRQRDAMLPPAPVECPMDDPDCLRRLAASNMAAWTFDNDFNTGQPEDPETVGQKTSLSAGTNWLGAGSQFAFDNGSNYIPDLNASQRINLEQSGVYKPLLQRNVTTNDRSGDLVSGAFNMATPGFGMDTDCPVSPSASNNYLEDCKYRRSDFNAADPTTSANAPSFLVRLRRTNDFQGLDNQTGPNQSGVSSSGAALPFLFGRGTTIQSASATYEPRLHGITVRATGIANVQPALRVGFANPALSIPGVVTTFALTASYWAGLGDNGSDVLTPTLLLDGTGALEANSNCLANPGVVTDPTQPASVAGAEIISGPPGTAPNIGFGYVPLSAVISGVNRVIGFGYVNVALSGTGVCPAPAGTSFTITRVSPYVAPVNATRLAAGGFPVQGADLASVLAANKSLADPSAGGLMVPALAR